MTMCVKGTHDFPYEDSSGAYCETHGVTLLFNGPPITAEDLDQDSPSRAARPAPEPPDLE